jgi:hypothetical protein
MSTVITVPPDPKPARTRKRPRTASDREASLNFRIVVFAVDGGCIVHDDPADCDGDFHAHHVVTQAQLRAAALFDQLWDANNGACVCETVHRRHHRGSERIRRDRLPARCIAFAREYGFDAVLDRYYPSGGQ